MKITPHKWADQQVAVPRKLQALLHALASFADPKGIAYPSQETIARRLGWSKGTIKKWSDVGRALGLFSVKKRFNASKGHVDGMTYTLHLDRVITADEGAMQIANLRFPHAEANRKNGDFPPAEANRKNEGGKSQLAANNSSNSMEELTKTKVVEDRPSQVGPAGHLKSKPSTGRDWLLVSSAAGDA